MKRFFESQLLLQVMLDFSGRLEAFVDRDTDGGQLSEPPCFLKRQPRVARGRRAHLAISDTANEV
jgi:hypothetical protein